MEMDGNGWKFQCDTLGPSFLKIFPDDSQG